MRTAGAGVHLPLSVFNISEGLNHTENLQNQRDNKDQNPWQLSLEDQEAADRRDAEDDEGDDDLQQGLVAGGGHRVLVFGILQVVVTVVRLHLRVGEGEGQDVDWRPVEELLVCSVFIDQVYNLFVVHVFTMFTVSGVLFCENKKEYNIMNFSLDSFHLPVYNILNSFWIFRCLHL